MKKDIYIITNDINDKVYIGQSVNAYNRFLQHKSESALKSNNMLIHKAMRKYGIEHFTYYILESQIENFDEREQYWIKYYNSIQPNGYNICCGGEGLGQGIFHPSAKLKSIEDLMLVYDLIKNSNVSFQAIAEKYKMSEAQISGINTGHYYHNNEFIYPLRIKSYSEDLLKQITYALKYENDKSLQKIAQEYNIDYSQLSEINTGKIYYREYLQYPIRQSKEFKTRQILPNIITDLQKTNLTQKEIAKKYNISQMTVSNINLGNSWHDNSLVYPLRKNTQNQKVSTISPDLLKVIIQEIQNTSKSMSEIGRMYNINSNTIRGINSGSIKKYRLNNIIYPIRH